MIPAYLDEGYAPLPDNIIFEVTYRCNLKCQMCYLMDDYLNHGIAEISLAQIERFLDSLPNKPNIVLTGGEAFARSDIMSIVAAVKRRGMKCCIFSNGTLLSETKIRELIDLGLDSISFSLDGPKEVFEDVTLIRGSFDRLMRNLELLRALRKDAKPKITLSCVLSHKSIDNIDFLFKYVADPDIALVSFLHLHFVTQYDSDRNDELFEKCGIPKSPPAVNRQQWGTDLELAEKVIELRRKAQDFSKVEFLPDLDETEIRAWYGDSRNFPVRESCFYPWVTSRIAPNGSVYVCQNHVVSMGSIAENDFQEIWNNARFRFFRSTLRAHGMFPGCNRCCKVKAYTRPEFPEHTFPVLFA